MDLPGEFLKVAQILRCISDLVGKPAEGDSDVAVDFAVDPWHRVEGAGVPRVR